MNWTVYYQNPEMCDEQGLYLKAEGEQGPWSTEKDAEEFDYFNDPAQSGLIIRDKTSAQKWLSEVAQMNGDVVQAVMI